ncbi:hypothetical protein M404DRAFT_28947 [Pisolithus tinctorius Marx 270]|uniref:Aspartic peptidase DDI1-type domain-containing protein n=1 Tax=Pisolithus tinctorius Marx 270 TaxID=870435 RepID=A0A0C3NJR2_PISTI|nr:hypothetical protein M404DRAFT_28947 [Pisolithus tinctorius Marx 270]
MREEQQAPIVRIEHEEDPPTNVNMFVAVHNTFQYIKRARIEEYVSEGEDTAEEVISETEYEARWAGTEQVLAAARREENKQQQKTPKFDGDLVGPARRTLPKQARRTRESNQTEVPAGCKDLPLCQRPSRASRKIKMREREVIAAMRVLNQYLDQSVTIPGRDLLTISLDVRREFKDRAMTKRVALGATLSGASDMLEGLPQSIDVRAFECGIGEERYAQTDSMPLTMVEVELAGKVMLEGILDSSSQIVALRQEIAEVLHLPIERDS